MSLKQNDTYNEYMAELECNICQNTIQMVTENREDSMGQGYEYEWEDGHSENCRYFMTSNRTQSDKLFNAPMPKFKSVWTEEDELEHRRIIGQKFLEEGGWQ
jgi:hypothetical protein